MIFIKLPNTSYLTCHFRLHNYCKDTSVATYVMLIYSMTTLHCV